MSDESITSGNDETGAVGYGRPPASTRFQKGVSGNPRGRPKGARNVGSIVSGALSERVTISVNGRRKRITKLEAAVMQLVNRAAGGDLRSTKLLITLVQESESKTPKQEIDQPTSSDRAVMRELQRRALESSRD
jgi:hypothetical protein